MMLPEFIDISKVLLSKRRLSVVFLSFATDVDVNVNVGKFGEIYLCIFYRSFWWPFDFFIWRHFVCIVKNSKTCDSLENEKIRDRKFIKDNFMNFLYELMKFIKDKINRQIIIVLT